MNKKKAIAIGGIVAILAIGGFFFMKKRKKQPISVSSDENESGKKTVVDKVADVISKESNVSKGFDPKGDAEEIYDDLNWWTSVSDQQNIINVLKSRTYNERKIIENYFNTKLSPNESMREWLKTDLNEYRFNEVKKLMGYK